MKDRTPANPGRVLITPENGGTPYYATVTRADNPTQEGTRLNKYNLLKDATAAMFGMDGGAVPDGVLQYIGKYAQYWWKRLALVAATRYREKKTQLASGTFFVKHGAKYYKSVSVDPVTGEITPEEPFDIVSVDDYYNAYVVGDFVVNKGSSKEYTDNAGVYYFTSGISKKGSSGSGSEFYQNYVQAVTAEAYQINAGGTDFVQSPSADAYPHSGSDGSFEYTYLGQPWENSIVPVKVAVGSYVGTGTSREEGAVSLTLDFVPKFVVVQKKTTSGLKCMLFGINGITVTILSPNKDSSFGSDSVVNFKWEGNKVSWYTTSGYAHYALNESGITYYYIAIG